MTTSSRSIVLGLLAFTAACGGDGEGQKGNGGVVAGGGGNGGSVVAGTGGKGGNAGAGSGGNGNGGAAGTDGSAGAGGKGGTVGSAGRDGGVDGPVTDAAVDGPRVDAATPDGGSPDAPPASPDGLSSQSLSISYSHACAIWGTTLKCWGDNQYGQLGYEGQSSTNLMPAVVPGEWIAVAASGNMTCAIKTDNSLWCWGQNRYGSLGLGSTSSSSRSAPGKVGDGYVRVAANGGNGCGIKTDGTLWCWGDGGGGILGYCDPSITDTCDYPPPSGRPLRVAAPDTFQDIRLSDVALAMHTPVNGPDARLWAWGNNWSTYKYKAAVLPGTATDTYGAQVSQVAPGYFHHLMRFGTTVKRIAGWGYPAIDTTAPTGVTDVSAASYTMCLINGTKDLYCRGNNEYGQLANGNWIPSRAYEIHVDAWTKIKGPEGNWVNVAVGTTSVCARDANDVIWCWGNNSKGQLGDGSMVSRSLPSQVGQPAPAHSCTDGVANGTETKIDCGGSECIACPTCTDGIKNQDESDVDCGGSICTKRCESGKTCKAGADCGCTSTVAGVCETACPAATGVCTPWCEDRDSDGAGVGPACSGADCDDNDGKWIVGCRIRDLFKGVPGTKTLNATIERNDYECVVNFTGAYCAAQNDPACVWNKKSSTTKLDVTLNSDGVYSIQAPYMDMCTADYVGKVVDVSGNPTGEAVATSYPVPMASKFWYYAPRDTDKCRANILGNDVPVEHRVSTTMSGDQIIIEESCHTQFVAVNPNTGSPEALSDDRSWTVKTTAP